MDALHNSSSDSLSSNSSSFLAVPIMYAFTSLLLLGSSVFQTILGRPDVSRMRRENAFVKRAVDDFIEKEEPIALDSLLCAIGPDGCNAKGVSSGIVIASPSTQDPDCMQLSPTPSTNIG